MKKSKNSSRVLANQKIRKNRFSFFFKANPPVTILTLIALLLIPAIFFFKDTELYTPKKNISLIQHSNTDSVSIRSKIEGNVFQSPKHVRQFALNMQRELSARRVHLFRLNPSLYSIRFEFFKPVAAVQLGSGKLVNYEGKVFGSFDETKHSQLPYIKGLKINNKLVHLEDQSLSVSPKNTELIKESLLLINAGMRYNINYRTILFDPYRGFSALLRDKRIRVEMGRSPFDKKYKKLEKILASLAKKRVNTARIELDFQGKAFVKEF